MKRNGNKSIPLSPAALAYYLPLNRGRAKTGYEQEVIQRLTDICRLFRAGSRKYEHDKVVRFFVRPPEIRMRTGGGWCCSVRKSAGAVMHCGKPGPPENLILRCVLPVKAGRLNCLRNYWDLYGPGIIRAGGGRGENICAP